MIHLSLGSGARKIVIVKSAQHFHAGFAPIAGEILYVAGPGVVAPEFAEIPLTKLDRPLWPRVADPFEAQAPAAD
jgi:microcystin degradation protein MlrC